MAGLYTCVAVSERGVEATGTLVCVAERPPAPGAPRIAGQSGSSVKLEWSPSPEPALPALPYPLPGAPLELFRRALQTLFYCIEFSTNGTPVILSSIRVSHTQTTCSISNGSSLD